MKKLIFALASPLLLLFSCKKKSDNHAVPAVDTMRYTINNMQDILTSQYNDTTVYMPLQFEYFSGMQESVTVSLVPGDTASMWATPTSFSGTPSFSGTFTIRLRTLTSGTMPVTVTSTGTISGKKTLSFNVIASASTACEKLVNGYYTETPGCKDTTSYYYAQVADDTVGDNKVMIYCRETQGQYIKVILNCSNSSFTIPSTAIGWGTNTVSGSGSYDKNGIVINWHIVPPASGGPAYDCTTTLVKRP